VHFRYVHQTFNAFFQFSKAAVVGQVGDNRFDLGAFWVTTLDFDPRIFAQLLETQRYAVALAVELEHLDFDFLTNSNDLAWVLDTFPGHVGDVQQAIDAAEVNERTVVGEVLDDTFDGLTFLQAVEQFVALGGVDRLEYCATAYNHVVALLIQF